jgi:hypothetical protein
VLPKGYDAEGIAAEEVDKLMLEVKFGTLQMRDTPLGERGRRQAPELEGSRTVLRGGFTPAKAVKNLYTAKELREELGRRVSQRMRRLSRLTENKAVVSEWDVVQGRGNGAPVSVFAWIPGRILNPDEALMQKEDLELLERFKEEFKAWLGPEEEELRRFFGCIWDGIEGRVEIAEALGLSPEAAVGLRRRLSRRVKEFRAQASGDMAEMLGRLP